MEREEFGGCSFCDNLLLTAAETSGCVRGILAELRELSRTCRAGRHAWLGKSFCGLFITGLGVNSLGPNPVNVLPAAGPLLQLPCDTVDNRNFLILCQQNLFHDHACHPALEREDISSHKIKVYRAAVDKASAALESETGIDLKGTTT